MSEAIEPGMIESCRMAARLGGEAIRGNRDPLSVREKSPADFVTQVDLASQRAIVECLLQRHPAHQLLAEEQSPRGEVPAEGYCWLVDPLDGTTNFVHGLPHYAVSVALALNGRPVMGCIVDPVRDEEFWAARGCGAWLNDQPLQTRPTERLAEALVAVSLPARVDISSPAVEWMLRALQRCRSVRRLGSAALNLAYIAAGRIDAYWATALRPWDMAAGVVLIEEAGGVVTQLDGGPHQLDDPQVCAAATEPLHAELRELLS